MEQRAITSRKSSISTTPCLELGQSILAEDLRLLSGPGPQFRSRWLPYSVGSMKGTQITTLFKQRWNGVLFQASPCLDLTSGLRQSAIRGDYPPRADLRVLRDRRIPLTTRLNDLSTIITWL